MAPSAIANRIRGHSTPEELGFHGDRHSHLPTVLHLVSNDIKTLGVTLCLVLLLVLLAQVIKRRCSLRSGHPPIESGLSPHRKKTVGVCGNGANSEKSAIMAKSKSNNSQHNQHEDPSSAPAAVLRPQARTPTPHSGPSRSIALAQGRYTGVVLPGPPTPALNTSSSSCVPRDVEAWRGIPYAQTTGGANRFRPPVPLPPYDIRNRHVKADTFGPVCPSTASAVINAWEGEDCLNLNVYRPASYNDDDDDRLLPVIIYVHGGAFNAGSGTERNMASFVSWAETPLLAVSFNYRVGALGFPSSTVAEREGCLNLGLRDQRMLFEWVRDNIGAFGGDGGRVTIMGMSAGAHSIGYHLQSYTDPATAPFQGAIMESGGPTARATLSPSHPRTESQWREFLIAAGINLDATTASSRSSDQVFAILRTLPLETIIRASNAVFSRFQDPIRWPFQPVIESDDTNGQLITDLPISSFRRGKYLRIPILTGFNSNEGTVFCSPQVDTNEQFLQKFTTMIPGLSDADLAALMKVYPDPVTQPEQNKYGDVPPGFGRQWARYEAAYAHYAYICPVLQTGHFCSNNSNSNGDKREAAAAAALPSPTPPIWIYNFAALSRPDFGGKANHVDEAVVVSHDMGAIGQFPGLVATSDAMHGAFVRFIVTGNPNPISDSNSTSEWWPRFTSPLKGDDKVLSPGQFKRGVEGGQGQGVVMMFGADNDERMGGTNRGTPALVRRLSEGEVEECRFWWERVELSEGMGRRLADGRRARL